MKQWGEVILFNHNTQLDDLSEFRICFSQPITAGEFSVKFYGVNDNQSVQLGDGSDFTISGEIIEQQFKMNLTKVTLMYRKIFFPHTISLEETKLVSANESYVNELPAPLYSIDAIVTAV